MGLFEKLFGAPTPQPGVFQLADGKLITAKEYGYASASGFINQPATEQFRDCYGNPKYGEYLPFTDEIVENPTVANLYFMALYTGIYHFYATGILRVDEQTSVDIKIGITDAAKDMRIPSGEALPENTKSSFIGASLGFSKAVAADIDEASRIDPRALRPILHSHSTKLLLSFIEQSYRKPRPDVSSLPSGIGAKHIARISEINNTSSQMLQILKNHLKIRFLKSQ
ncbi:hypothetical protein [Massilia sp. PWRC2]|uniref:hypothetical protein n=1 Tax=Massilia sp. PWRC2 TaxID=2804626 RepID=UPI003CF16001